MFGVVNKIWMLSARSRKKRTLDNVRRKFESCGYTLDDLTDSELEAVITRGEGGIEKVLPLTAKAIYWTLRRISPDSRQLRRRKIKQPQQMQTPGYY
jgi:hypothetical protein